jgi:hypothetical protein
MFRAIVTIILILAIFFAGMVYERYYSPGPINRFMDRYVGERRVRSLENEIKKRLQEGAESVGREIDKRLGE